MSKLDDIAVIVESKRPRPANIEIATGILREICSALKEFNESGRPQAIDLRNQPRMHEKTYRFLEEVLARGEVAATVEAELRAEIFETRYSGVWWVRHRNERGDITTEILEVTEVPGILKAHRVDMRGALLQLEQYLQTPFDGDEADSPAGCEWSAAAVPNDGNQKGGPS